MNIYKSAVVPYCQPVFSPISDHGLTRPLISWPGLFVPLFGNGTPHLEIALNGRSHGRKTGDAVYPLVEWQTKQPVFPAAPAFPAIMAE